MPPIPPPTCARARGEASTLTPARPRRPSTRARSCLHLVASMNHADVHPILYPSPCHMYKRCLRSVSPALITHLGGNSRPDQLCCHLLFRKRCRSSMGSVAARIPGNCWSAVLARAGGGGAGDSSWKLFLPDCASMTKPYLILLKSEACAVEGLTSQPGACGSVWRVIILLEPSIQACERFPMIRDFQ